MAHLNSVNRMPVEAMGNAMTGIILLALADAVKETAAQAELSTQVRDTLTVVNVRIQQNRVNTHSGHEFAWPVSNTA
jgi:hypothetical protein